MQPLCDCNSLLEILSAEAAEGSKATSHSSNIFDSFCTSINTFPPLICSLALPLLLIASIYSGESSHCIMTISPFRRCRRSLDILHFLSDFAVTTPSPTLSQILHLSSPTPRRPVSEIASSGRDMSQTSGPFSARSTPIAVHRTGKGPARCATAPRRPAPPRSRVKVSVPEGDFGPWRSSRCLVRGTGPIPLVACIISTVRYDQCNNDVR